MEKLLYHHLAEKDFNMKKLNSLETLILETILIENKEKYPSLVFHLPYLYIKNREYTSVGVYSNFGYKHDEPFNDINELLSSERKLMLEKLKYELTYTLDITNGKLNFLEICTNGNEMWDGSFDNFKLE